MTAHIMRRKRHSPLLSPAVIDSSAEANLDSTYEDLFANAYAPQLVTNQQQPTKMYKKSDIVMITTGSDVSATSTLDDQATRDECDLLQQQVNSLKTQLDDSRQELADVHSAKLSLEAQLKALQDKQTVEREADQGVDNKHVAELLKTKAELERAKADAQMSIAKVGQLQRDKESLLKQTQILLTEMNGQQVLVDDNKALQSRIQQLDAALSKISSKVSKSVACQTNSQADDEADNNAQIQRYRSIMHKMLLEHQTRHLEREQEVQELTVQLNALSTAAPLIHDDKLRQENKRLRDELESNDTKWQLWADELESACAAQVESLEAKLEQMAQLHEEHHMAVTATLNDSYQLQQGRLKKQSK